MPRDDHSRRACVCRLLVPKDQLSIWDSELFPFGSVQHSKEMVQTALEAAGGNAAVNALPFGATDAAVFSRMGLPSVCVQASSTTELPPEYHTRRDNSADAVREGAMSRMRGWVLSMVTELSRATQSPAELAAEDISGGSAAANLAKEDEL